MFKQNIFFIFFEGITLLILFSVSAFLMAINIPTPFGNGDKSSFSNINQPVVAKSSPAVLFSSDVKTPQGAWDFLNSQQGFDRGNLKTEDWDSWLAIIQKRKIRQTVSEEGMKVVNLTSLWNVALNTPYVALTPEAKTTLADISQLSVRGWDYRLVTLGVIDVSFKKETRDVVVDLIKMLKENNRWSDLKKYEIEKIADIDIKPLLEIANIGTLSANKDTYNVFSEPVKVSLRNLLDLDLSASDNFKRKYPRLVFENETNVNQILNALATRIDEIITPAAAISDAWTFLKTSNRLANLKKYKINTIDTVTLLPTFQNVALTKEYPDLSLIQKTILYNLSQKTTYQKKINDLITKEKDAETAWTFLKTSNRLTNLKKYQINTIDTVVLLPALQTVALTKTYARLTNAQKTLLHNLSQKTTYQKTINDLIQKDQDAENAWAFLKTENRLTNLKKYQFKTINGIALLPLLPDITLKKEYLDLSLVQKTTLYNLIQLTNYQEEIKKIINPRNVWKFLQTNNHLKQLQTKKTLKTNIFDLNILAKTKSNVKYKTLTNKQTTALYILSKLGNYQYEIKKALIKLPKLQKEDHNNLLWLWIAWPFSVLLILKLWFSLYHFKKISIFKFKKRKE